MPRAPFLQRKKTVEHALGTPTPSQRIRPVQYLGEQGKRFYEAASALHMEGIILQLQATCYRLNADMASHSASCFAVSAASAAHQRTEHSPCA